MMEQSLLQTLECRKMHSTRESQWNTTKTTAVKYEKCRRRVIANSRYGDGDHTVCVGTVTRRTSVNITFVFPLRIL